MEAVNVFEAILADQLRPEGQRLDTPRKQALDLLDHCGLPSVDNGDKGVDFQFVFPRAVVRRTAEMLASCSRSKTEVEMALGRFEGWRALVDQGLGGEEILADAVALLEKAGVSGDKI